MQTKPLNIRAFFIKNATATTLTALIRKEKKRKRKGKKEKEKNSCILYQLVTMELMTSYSFLINSLEVYIYFWEGVVSQLIRPLSVSINGCKYMYILEDSGNSIILVTYGVTKVT